MQYHDFMPLLPNHIHYILATLLTSSSYHFTHYLFCNSIYSLLSSPQHPHIYHYTQTTLASRERQVIGFQLLSDSWKGSNSASLAGDSDQLISGLWFQSAVSSKETQFLSELTRLTV